MRPEGQAFSEGGDSAMNKALISEVEDAMRRQSREDDYYSPGKWPVTRQAFIEHAAWTILFVENGDANAAAQTQDPGTDSGS